MQCALEDLCVRMSAVQSTKALWEVKKELEALAEQVRTERRSEPSSTGQQNSNHPKGHPNLLPCAFETICHDQGYCMAISLSMLLP